MPVLSRTPQDFSVKKAPRVHFDWSRCPDFGGPVGLDLHRPAARLRSRGGVADVLDRGDLGRLEIRPVVEPHLGGLLADPNIAPWVGRLVILVLVLLVGWVMGMLLGYFTRSLGLGPLDRVIGLFFASCAARCWSD